MTDGSAPTLAPEGGRPRLTRFDRWAGKAFGRGAGTTGTADDALARAHWLRTPDEFRASTLLLTTVIALAAGVASAVVADLALRSMGVLVVAGVALAAAGLAGGLGYVVVSDLPNSRALARRQGIDRHLPRALGFVAAMSCADVPLDEIFRELSHQPIYGEVASEAAWIVRDTDLLGRDILSAVRDATHRSPSPGWEEFLQGLVTTSESGGDLRSYFLAQADRYERDGMVRVQGQLERLGTYAEAYVTVAVAFPLFLLVILTVFTLIEGAANHLLTFVWLTALGIIPAAELAFGLLFRRLGEDT